MQYGYFDPVAREYVIDRVDTPVSWTNYIGLKDMYGVFNQTAGGYLLYRSPQYHRITRFRANAVPMDRPGRYVYIRDNETEDCWSISGSPPPYASMKLSPYLSSSLSMAVSRAPLAKVDSRHSFICRCIHIFLLYLHLYSKESVYEIQEKICMPACRK